ncbi:hypothetical protein ACS0TY_031476 [Phlomoides rotata]
MESVVDEGRRVCREERGKMCVEMKPRSSKVEVVYYLSRSNGHLDQPHYIQLPHLPHQQLRLKDVLDRLTVLRGKGMPSLYSWSCKRSYKNGYVWNDLAENDAVLPAGGSEYVLKGSELPLGCTEKLHHLQLGNVEHFQLENNRSRVPDSNIQPKRRFVASKRQINLPETMNNQYDPHPQEEEEVYEGKTMHTRCSRGVSTEEIEEEFKHKHSLETLHTRCSRGFSTEETEEELKHKHSLETNYPSSTTSSTLSDNNLNDYNNSSKILEDGDPVGSEPMLSRNSMLFNLIACGGSGSNVLPPLPPRKSSGGGGSSLHKGVVCRVAKMAAREEQDNEMMISYMSENPRFGNLQSEEKEYFSGSIVESITNEERLDAHHGLKKSSSYNQERSRKAGIAEVTEEEAKEEKGVKGKCIPRKKKKSTSKSSKIEN